MSKTISGVGVDIQDQSISIDGNTILKNINWRIDAGSFNAVVGRSGSGKSTLLKILAGLLASSDNHILFRDLQGNTVTKPSVRIMFQEPRLLPWKSVADNITIGCKKTPEVARQAAALLHDVGLSGLANRWPSSLSGGQQQRVALARAILHRPQLLLLDEPLGALDALTRLEMQSLLERLWDRYRFTVILVTHDIREAVLLSDHIVLMDHGQIKNQYKVIVTRPRHKQSEVLGLEEIILNELLAL